MTLPNDVSRCEGSFPSLLECSRREGCARYAQRYDREPLWRAMYLCDEEFGTFAKFIPEKENK